MAPRVLAKPPDHLVGRLPVPHAGRRAREFVANLPVSEEDREKIAHLNAERLFAL
jgi:predicted TIM-barrel fold metal-dependent hydrolase